MTGDAIEIFAERMREAEEAGVTIRRPKGAAPGVFALSAGGRRFALIELFGLRRGTDFDVVVQDPKGEEILGSRYRIPLDHRAAADLDGIVALVRARAVMSGSLAAADFPTDMSLRTFVERTATARASGPFAGVVRACRALGGEVTRKQALALLEEAAAIAGDEEFPGDAHAVAWNARRTRTGLLDEMTRVWTHGSAAKAYLAGRDVAGTAAAGRTGPGC